MKALKRADLNAAYRIIEEDLSGGDRAKLKQAFEVLMLARNSNAEPDSARLLHNIAFCYSEGLGVKKNLKKSLEYYRLSARSGSIVAYFNIAKYYEQGQAGVEKSKTKAFYYYKKSAERNYEWAFVNLGWCYRNGYGVKQNDKKAEHYWQMAAKKRNLSAMYNLGKLYEYSELKDLKKALRFYKNAADGGHEKALDSYKVLSRNLSKK